MSTNTLAIRLAHSMHMCALWQHRSAEMYKWSRERREEGDLEKAIMWQHQAAKMFRWSRSERNSCEHYAARIRECDEIWERRS